eukprot:TRINITY_DN10665_c1_g1_i1.p8 TRINITY_DN10665_c1_g1~~TRINITY_DN10665_c1_g1_i1.p8  ORF type:complete len:139 (+),score=2.25 TRINITY_DN10665_c1_g1_i1:994-1410(+)
MKIIKNVDKHMYMLCNNFNLVCGVVGFCQIKKGFEQTQLQPVLPSFRYLSLSITNAHPKFEKNVSTYVTDRDTYLLLICTNPQTTNHLRVFHRKIFNSRDITKKMSVRYAQGHLFYRHQPVRTKTPKRAVKSTQSSGR